MPNNWTFKATRRKFLHYMGMATVAGRTLLGSDPTQAATRTAEGASGKAWPEMTYRDFGKTGFRGSRLVFGCGAALSGEPRDELLDRALDAGVNVFDVGTRRYYKDAEKNLKPFLAKNRDRIFLISKASPYIDIEPDEKVTAAQARDGARTWTSLLDQSLSDLGVDHVDAYYIMGAHNPSIVGSDEMYEAFLRAKEAGKTRFWGISTHQNAQKVLTTAAETGRFALAQIAITPAGWYSWADKNILPDSPDMVGLRPVLDQAREAGIALIGMKAGRFLAGRKWLGWGNPDAFDHIYDKKFMSSDLNTFQRSYAYVLEHGLDAVNADMQSMPHLEQNFVAAATAQQYFA